jgi:hypothetical protein
VPSGGHAYGIGYRDLTWIPVLGLGECDQLSAATDITPAEIKTLGGPGAGQECELGDPPCTRIYGFEVGENGLGFFWINDS